MGIDRVDHMLMVLGVSLMMQEKDREIITREMIRGFDEAAKEASTNVTGGQSIMNPWPIIGGVANVMCRDDEYIKPNNGKDGDVLILSKPLGTQPAVNLLQSLRKMGLEVATQANMSAEKIEHVYHLACESMATLNINTARLMMKYKSNGGTDITGFGLLGHAKNLAAAQFGDIDLHITHIPVLENMETVFSDVGLPDFKVREGLSAETSGGILCMIPQENADDFIKES